MTSPEEWRPIPGYEDRYFVSDQGRIATKKNSELVGRKLNDATTYLSFSVAGNPQKSLYVHRIVALVFHGPRPPGMIIRHLDGNRFNNSATNIAYGTPQQNHQDTVKHGTHKGIRNGRSKLDEKDVKAIKILLSECVGLSTIARAFNVTPAQINHIDKKRQWKHI